MAGRSTQTSKGVRAPSSQLLRTVVCAGGGLAFVAVLASAGCGNGLHHNGGVGWTCRYAAVSGDDFEIGSSADAPITICANPHDSPQDVSSACDDKCKVKWCEYGLFSEQPFLSLCPVNCQVQSVTPSEAPCPPGSDSAGPSRERTELTFPFHVTVDSDSADTTVRGPLLYSISSECAGTVCPFEIVDLDFVVAPFQIKGKTVRGRIQIADPATGVYHTDTLSYELVGVDALRLSVEFFLDNDEGSVVVSSHMMTVAGHASFIGGNVGGFFGMVGTVSDGNVTVNFNIAGLNVNTPPQAHILPKGPVECDAPKSAHVTLDGSHSFDFEDNIASYAFYLGNPPNQQLAQRRSSNNQAPATLALGHNLIQLDLTDSFSSIGNARQDIEVVDTTPPTVDIVRADPSCLWPPNHKLVLFELGSGLIAHATDVCDSAPTIKIVNVRSNQPPLGGGQGNFSPDVFFGGKAFCVRSERQGASQPPREYTVTVEATDFAGNKTTRDVVVTVAHDQAGVQCSNVDPGRIAEDGDPRCTAN